MKHSLAMAAVAAGLIGSVSALADPAPTDAAPAGAASPSAPAASATPAQPESTLSLCRRITLPENTREIVTASPNVAVRVKFPAKVKTYSISVPGLWDAESKEDSVLIRPKTPDAAAGETAVAVFTDTGRQYDLLVRLAPSGTDIPSCVIVADLVPPPAAASGTPRRAVGPSKAVTALERQLQDAIANQNRQLGEMRSQVEQQATDRIKAFQYSVYTRYDWNSAQAASPDDKHLISSVYDDGRFTYVRISTTAFGLPEMTGDLGGKATVLQYTYDDLTGVFTVQGLFDKLTVALADHVISISRL